MPRRALEQGERDRIPVARLEENPGTAGWSLTAEELARLDEASAFDLGYPAEFIRRVNEEQV